MRNINFLGSALVLLLLYACSDDEGPIVDGTNGFDGKKINTIQKLTSTLRENEAFVYNGDLLSERNSERKAYSICTNTK